MPLMNLLPNILNGAKGQRVLKVTMSCYAISGDLWECAF